MTQPEENNMPDTVRKVNCYATSVANKPGQVFKVLSTLVGAGVNVLACQGVPVGRRARFEVVPDDARRFSAAARKAGIAFDKKRSGFLIQGDDRPGALAGHLKLLADAGINVDGIEGATGGQGRWGAIVWVAEKDSRRAGRLLRAKVNGG
jgi:hypothetical protein